MEIMAFVTYRLCKYDFVHSQIINLNTGIKCQLFATINLFYGSRPGFTMHYAS